MTKGVKKYYLKVGSKTKDLDIKDGGWGTWLGIKGDQITEGGGILAKLVSRILASVGWGSQDKRGPGLKPGGGEGGRACMRFG